MGCGDAISYVSGIGKGKGVWAFGLGHPLPVLFFCLQILKKGTSDTISDSDL